jgi:hypothetical protein
MISPDQFLVIYYLMFLAVRIRGCLRRWRQPLVRGPEWFFSVRVQPDFYSGPGKKILHRYRMGIFIPFAVDIPVATAIFISGRFVNLAWLMVFLAILIHVNHMFSVDFAERQARRFALPETVQPVSSVMLSLKPRRLSDYTNPRIEAFMVIGSLGVIAWLVRYYLNASADANLRVMLAVPLLLLYCQIGLLFVKSGLVAWRAPVPSAQAEEHIQAREAARRLNLKVCDWYRVCYTAQLMVWPMLVNGSAEHQARALTWFSVGLLVVAIVLTAYHERGRRAVLNKQIRAIPMTMPDFIGAGRSSWLVCYQPAAPMVLIKGSHGYSLNFANRLTQFGTMYLAGFIALIAALRMIH